MMKLACRALTAGAKGQKMDEACQALSGKHGLDDKDVYLPLVTGNNPEANGGAVVKYLGQDPSAVEAELVTGLIRSMGDIEAVAIPAPVMIEIQVPSGNHQPGEPLFINGPDGPIRVHLPRDAAPGSSLRIKIAPRPEYRIEVPPGAGPGWLVRFSNQDGVEVAVPVPPGLQTGDFCEVSPPALMVRVPEQAKPGDFVFFKRRAPLDSPTKGGATSVMEFYRAQVPEGCQPCDFFSAIIPKPIDDAHI
mmetsp:Transcript_42067/g.122042  ORF Transcript_42067/g.122042 Transcript_42067/m.122042 type:complete len:248 (+) Transcript_42067:90-833(+)